MAKKVYLGSSDIELATMEGVQEAIQAALPAWLGNITGDEYGVQSISAGTATLALKSGDSSISIAPGTVKCTGSSGSNSSVLTLMPGVTMVSGYASNVTAMPFVLKDARTGAMATMICVPEGLLLNTGKVYVGSTDSANQVALKSDVPEAVQLPAWIENITGNETGISGIKAYGNYFSIYQEEDYGTENRLTFNGGAMYMFSRDTSTGASSIVTLSKGALDVKAAASVDVVSLNTASIEAKAGITVDGGPGNVAVHNDSAYLNLTEKGEAVLSNRQGYLHMTVADTSNTSSVILTSGNQTELVMTANNNDSAPGSLTLRSGGGVSLRLDGSDFSDSATNVSLTNNNAWLDFRGNGNVFLSNVNGGSFSMYQDGPSNNVVELYSGELSRLILQDDSASSQGIATLSSGNAAKLDIFANGSSNGIVALSSYAARLNLDGNGNGAGLVELRNNSAYLNLTRDGDVQLATGSGRQLVLRNSEDGTNTVVLTAGGTAKLGLGFNTLEHGLSANVATLTGGEATRLTLSYEGANNGVYLASDEQTHLALGGAVSTETGVITLSNNYASLDISQIGYINLANAAGRSLVLGAGTDVVTLSNGDAAKLTLESSGSATDGVATLTSGRDGKLILDNTGPGAGLVTLESAGASIGFNSSGDVVIDTDGAVNIKNTSAHLNLAKNGDASLVTSKGNVYLDNTIAELNLTSEGTATLAGGSQAKLSLSTGGSSDGIVELTSGDVTGLYLGGGYGSIAGQVRLLSDDARLILDGGTSAGIVELKNNGAYLTFNAENDVKLSSGYAGRLELSGAGQAQLRLDPSNSGYVTLTAGDRATLTLEGTGVATLSGGSKAKLSLSTNRNSEGSATLASDAMTNLTLRTVSDSTGVISLANAYATLNIDGDGSIGLSNDSGRRLDLGPASGAGAVTLSNGDAATLTLKGNGSSDGVVTLSGGDQVQLMLDANGAVQLGHLGSHAQLIFSSDGDVHIASDGDVYLGGSGSQAQLTLSSSGYAALTAMGQIDLYANGSMAYLNLTADGYTYINASSEVGLYANGSLAYLTLAADGEAFLRSSKDLAFWADDGISLGANEAINLNVAGSLAQLALTKGGDATLKGQNNITLDALSDINLNANGIYTDCDIHVPGEIV